MVTILSIIRLSSWRYVLSLHPFVYPPSSQTNWHDDEVMLFGNVIGLWLSFLIRGHSWLRDYPRFTFCKPWGMLLVTLRDDKKSWDIPLWNASVRLHQYKDLCTFLYLKGAFFLFMFASFRKFFFEAFVFCLCDRYFSPQLSCFLIKSLLLFK